MDAEELGGFLFVAVALGQCGDEGGFFATGEVERLFLGGGGEVADGSRVAGE